MYLPKHFAAPDDGSVLAMMQDNPLANIVYLRQDTFVADCIPLHVETDEKGTRLIGHVARANPLWVHASKVLVIFSGQQGYVSPQWYESKSIDGKVVPTWNYQTVHCHGSVSSFDEPDRLLELLNRLTTSHESGFSEPWRVSDAPSDYIDKMCKAIVGIEIFVEKIEAKFKLSQNKSVKDVQRITEGLVANGGQPLANVMSVNK